jgi:AraC-like DNA-binding protein/ligand-binding sensor domain-containing protein
MKTKKVVRKTKQIALLLSLLPAWPFPDASAASTQHDYVFSTINRQQGLSNSAVICMLKDDSELMWFGTYDGLNCFDGREMEVFHTGSSLDNNVIYGISKADGRNLWVSTLLGINRFSTDKKEVVANWSVPHGAFLSSGSRGETWLVCADSIAYYNTFHERFISVEKPDIVIGEPTARCFVADDGTLWMFPDRRESGEVYKVSIGSFDSPELQARLDVQPSQFHTLPIENIYYQSGVSFCFVDSDKVLYMYDMTQHTKVRVRSIDALLNKYGPITGVAPFYDDFVVAFHTNGLMRLKMAESYEEEVIDKSLRVFSLYKDPEQGILWLGLDGKGAMTYARHRSLATNLMTSRLSTNFTRQVRSITTDRYGGLWYGTKGDGLIHIKDYASGVDPDNASVCFPSGNYTARNYVREDTEFPVFSLLQSEHMDGLWVGSGSAGLFRYDFSDGRLHHLPSLSGEQPDEIHEIYEADAGTLYLATAISGFMKASLNERNGRVEMESCKRYYFNHEGQDISTFFSIIPEGDSVLWLGSRERGLVRFNMKTETYRVISLKELLDRRVDDVLSIHRARGGEIYVGTTAGLVRLNFEGKEIKAEYIGRENGLINDFIHGILEDASGFLWLSTNRGLVKYNPVDGSIHTYYHSAGIQIGEFSDDAYYKCPQTGRLFFGGIDGLLYMNPAVTNDSEYYPEIVLRRLSFDGKEADLVAHNAGGGDALEFRYTKGVTSWVFAVPDFLNGRDIEYSWMLDGYDNGWQPFGTSNEASWAGLPAGNYTLNVRYRKDIFDTEIKTLSIPLRVLPLWYQTTLARILFIILCATGIALITFMARKYVLNRRLIQKLQDSERRNTRRHGTITDDHKFSSTLTDIYLTCQRMQEGIMTSEQRDAMAERIRENVMSMFLTMETLSETEVEMFSLEQFSIAAPMSLKAISDEVMSQLLDRGMDMDGITVDIPDTFTFPVYVNAFRALFYYIYAFVSEPRRTLSVGLTVSVGKNRDMMTLSLSSPGKGVLGKLRESLCNDEKPHRKLSRDNETLFWIQLLHNLATATIKQLEPAVSWSDSDTGAQLSFTFRPAPGITEPVSGKKSVLVLEDREDMFWLIENILSVDYTVHNARSIQHALDIFRQSPPAAFIVDMAMYASTETALLDYIGNGSLLSSTALITLLSSGISPAVQRELVLASDAHLILPYDIVFLGEIVRKTVYGKREIKQIYIHEVGDFFNFVTCATPEQADFVRRVTVAIKSNIDREDLGSSYIASKMAMSLRQFYRKFKDVSDLPPTELIKHCRMEKAAELLVASELSIQDVITEVGISSRSYFYKEFAKKFGMTPKDYRAMHRETKDALICQPSSSSA